MASPDKPSRPVGVASLIIQHSPGDAISTDEQEPLAEIRHNVPSSPTTSGQCAEKRATELQQQGAALPLLATSSGRISEAVTTRPTARSGAGALRPTVQSFPVARACERHPGTERLSLGDNYRHLASCSFYFRRMSASEARERLLPCSPGTFLLRDSSDQRHLLALTVRLPDDRVAATSIRIRRTSSGKFRLDSDVAQADRMASFPSVIELVRHYVLGSGRSGCRVTDGRGVDGEVQLIQRLEAIGSPARLSHLARLAVHSARFGAGRLCVQCAVEAIPRIRCDDAARRQLLEYPFDI